MQRIKSFLVTTFIGGMAVTLPIAMIWAIIHWFFGLIAGFISPATNYLTNNTDMGQIISTTIVLATLTAACFGIGIFVKTSLGSYLFEEIERVLLKKIIGYTMIKETIAQFLSKDKSPFSQVAIVRLHNSDTWATGFITDRHEGDLFTVFIPCGPNPTTGFIYHVKGSDLQIVAHSVEDTMRSIISCGAGSREILRKFKESGKSF